MTIDDIDTTTATASALELPAIEVEHLSTSYRIHVGATTAWGGFLDLLHRGSEKDRVVPAIRDVSFDVPKGSVTCIVGRNGAGKSTLLRCLAGILAPQEGRVVVRGRITSLLTIGIGMNGRLTGRENIRLGGLAIGMEPDRLADLAHRRRIAAPVDRVADDLEDAALAGRQAALTLAVRQLVDRGAIILPGRGVGRRGVDIGLGRPGDLTAHIALARPPGGAWPASA